MRKLFKYALLSLFLGSFIAACDEEDPDLFPSEKIKGCYVINYGCYGKGGASVSRFNYDTDEVIVDYFKNQNDGLELLSNIQFAGEYNDSIYLMGNESDQVITVNPLFVQNQTGATGSLAKPRFFAGTGDYLYISCWGTNPDWSEMPDTYIAKFNTTTNSVEKTIALPGGPEGLAIVNGKLYAALNYKDSIAVIDLSTEAITYIATPAVSSYFLKDGNNNLYVSLVSTWADYSAQAGLGYINTSTNTLEHTYQLDGISTGYSQILSGNADLSKIYVLASAWVEEADGNWVQKGAAYTFDVATGTFSVFASNLTGANGISANPANNDVYVLTGVSTTEGGTIKIFGEDGTFKKELSCGISPAWTFFLE